MPETSSNSLRKGMECWRKLMEIRVNLQKVLSAIQNRQSDSRDVPSKFPEVLEKALKTEDCLSDWLVPSDFLSNEQFANVENVEKYEEQWKENATPESERINNYILSRNKKRKLDSWSVSAADEWKNMSQLKFSRGFKAMDQFPSSQMKEAFRSEKFGTILAKSKHNPTGKSNDGDYWDSDLYLSLLKNVNDDKQFWSELAIEDPVNKKNQARIQNREKLQLRRRSKGRTLREDQIEKLVNFMCPTNPERRQIEPLDFTNQEEGESFENFDETDLLLGSLFS